mmetsp:Transcript_11063/g.33281  ORF Transcript_11063/g.33281 Transcript_11063/m.33281 type:complete len:217 (-) Transcript_11063:964-1614(-)
MHRVGKDSAVRHSERGAAASRPTTPCLSTSALSASPRPASPLQLLRCPVARATAAPVRVTLRVLAGQSLVQDVVWGQVQEDAARLHLGVKGRQVQPGIADALARFQKVGVLVDRASHLRLISMQADDAPRQHLQLLVRAGVLHGVPLADGSVVVHGQLGLAHLDGGATSLWEVGLRAHVNPVPAVVSLALADLRRADDCGEVLQSDFLLLSRRLPF